MESGEVGPVRDPWTVAVYQRAGARRDLLGTGVLIDADRVLTCDHVVAKYRDQATALVVAFRKANLVPALWVDVADVMTAHPRADAAVLRLAAPVGIAPAPLLCPDPANVVGHRWWAFGFPGEATSPNGNDASGRVGALLADGYVRLDTTSRYVVERGFSGAGLWSQRYQKVVGLVGEARAGGANRGDAAAISLFHVDKALPEAKLEVLSGWRVDDAGEVAHAAWGWSLADDAEAATHWDPKSRGVHQGDERGYRFRGRRPALTRIAGWLARSSGDGRVLVVTGSPGVGKSALLGRVVTSADPDFARRLPADGEVRAPVGSVACAVHVKGKTALEVAEEIARSVAVRLPESLDDLVPALRRWLGDRPGRACNLVLDALDEATTPAQTRDIITRIAVPIAQQCAAVGARVLVATRRRDHDGSLLAAFGDAASVLDLDTSEYFEPADLTSYALATLQLLGSERPGNPYAHTPVAEPVAARIATVARGNFLVAGLVARAHGLHDTTPADPDRVVFPSDVATALRAYLRRLEEGGPVWTVPAFTALAHAQAPGLSIALWRVFLGAMGVTVPSDVLAAFTRTAAANFLIEAGSGGPEPVFRLFHQALDDALLDTPVRSVQRLAVAEALIELGRGRGWEDADDYLRRSLPVHAAEVGLLDTLLLDDQYLTHVDLPRLNSVADSAGTAAGRARARMLRLTPGVAEATPEQRAELLSVSAVLAGFGRPFAGGVPVRYRGRWAAVTPRNEHAILHGHTAPITAMCAVPVAGQTLLASAAKDVTVRLWDPVTGGLERILTGHRFGVSAVCAVPGEGRTLLASAGHDGMVLLWDPATGRLERTVEGPASPLRAVCAMRVPGRTLIAAATRVTVRLSDAATGEPGHALDDHVSLRHLCSITVGGRALLVTADGATLRVWDPVTGKLEEIAQNRYGSVTGICEVPMADHSVLAVVARRGVQLWDPYTGNRQQIAPSTFAELSGVCAMPFQGRTLLVTVGRHGVMALHRPENGRIERTLRVDTEKLEFVCAVPVAQDRTLLASADDDRVRLWDPLTAEESSAPLNDVRRIRSICPVPVGGRTLLATVDASHTRLWDPATGRQERLFAGNLTPATAIGTVLLGDRTVLATAEAGLVALWDPLRGARAGTLWTDTAAVYTVCAVPDGRRPLVAGVGDDGRVQWWDPATGDIRFPVRRFLRRLFPPRRTWQARASCAVPIGSRALLATTHGGQVRLWNPVTGRKVRTLGDGTAGEVWALCTVPDGQRTLLAAATTGQVQLWDPATWRLERSLPGRHTAELRCLCVVTVGGRALLASGGEDKTVRLVDPVTGELLMTIPVHGRALSCCATGSLLVVGMDLGLLAIDLDPPRPGHD